MLAPPILVEAYFQADLADGYGYLDSRGAIARHFGDEFQSFSETAQEGELPALLFQQPTDPGHPIAEMKVGIGQIWAHIRSGSTNTAIRQECSRIVETTSGLIGATRFTRQGLRVRYLFGTATTPDAVAAIRHIMGTVDSQWADIGEVRSIALNVQLAGDRIKANLQVAPVQSVRTRIIRETASESVALPPSDDTPKIGVLVDIDAFDDSPSDTRDPKPFLNRALRYIDDRLLPRIVQLLGEGIGL